MTNGAHFSRAFRAAYGITPREFRQRAWQPRRVSPP
jgi:AraC-like DNA-binding protein